MVFSEEVFLIPVVLSGGSGRRLWPVSRTKYPKQFTQLFDESLQNQTLKRVKKFGNPLIITSKTLRDFTEKKAQEAGFEKIDVYFEPESKNTAPAIAFLLRVLEFKNLSSEIVGIFPADHLIQNEKAFHAALDLAIRSAEAGKISTLGLKPSRPDTGYGYIETDMKMISYNDQFSSFQVLKFHEKPTVEAAKEFISDGFHYWNSGIIVFKASKLIELFKVHQPNIWNLFQELKPDLKNLKEIYEKLPSISIDYALMEKITSETICVPCDLGWDDVGSWDSVSEVYEKKTTHQLEVLEHDSKNNFVHPSSNKKYALVGVDDLIVVDTEDALLIVKKGHSQDVKTIVERLKDQNDPVIDEHVFEERPWGDFRVLKNDTANKTKVIHVNPGAQLSYQSHQKREEHWFIVKGQGEVVLNDEVIKVQAGSYIKIPQQSKHRMRNIGAQILEFIEVQMGSYFGEDDIIRYQDDYKRIES